MTKEYEELKKQAHNNIKWRKWRTLCSHLEVDKFITPERNENVSDVWIGYQNTYAYQGA